MTEKRTSDDLVWKNDMSTSQRIIAALRLRCPRCLQGRLYRDVLHLNEKCPNCGLNFNAEPGFYVGSIYPNYAATVVLVTGLYWLLAFGLGWTTGSTLWACIIFIALFPLWFHRYARSIWMTLVYEARHGTDNSPFTSPRKGEPPSPPDSSLPKAP